MFPQPTVVRPCGYMEKYSTARHSLNLYHCVSVTGRYAVPPGAGGRNEEHLGAVLQRAVAQVVREQSLMRVGIVDEDKQTTCFVHIPRIDLSKHVQVFGPCRPDEVDATLGKLLSYQHSQLWPDLPHRPPWKIAVIPIAKSNTSTSSTDSSNSFNQQAPAEEMEIVYSFHHAINDGTSGSIFHAGLLEALRTPAKHHCLPPPAPAAAAAAAAGSEIEGTTILELPDDVPTLPFPQNELINARISWSFFLATLWDAVGPSWLKSNPAVLPWTSRPIDLALPNQTSTRILRVAPPVATKLLATARAQAVTLTPLLHALIAASVARRQPAPEPAAAAAVAFKPSSAVSLRRYLPGAGAGGTDFDAEKHMLVLVTSADHTIPSPLVTRLRESSGSSDFARAIWEVADSVKASLATKLATLPDDDAGAMLKYVGNFHDYFRQRNGQKRGNSWELSNLGAISGGGGGSGAEDGNWTLTRLVFSQTASLVGPALSANVAGVAGGEITITLCWNPFVVDDVLVDGLATDLEAWIPEIANGHLLSMQKN